MFEFGDFRRLQIGKRGDIKANSLVIEGQTARQDKTRQDKRCNNPQV